MQRVVVTGGEGFIGSNFVKLLLNETDYGVINLDKRSYAGSGDNIKHMGLDKNKRYKSIQGDINDTELLEQLIQNEDVIVNFAAESHVDRSLQNNDAANNFLINNAGGTLALLNEARKKDIRKFVQISTDEVYGGIDINDKTKFNEDGRLKPGNPYSASKVASEAEALAFWNSFKVPVVITRSSNNYGPYQYPEKFIPLMITNILQQKKIPVYGLGENIRDWIHVEDNCRAILNIMEKGRDGETYNIAGRNEKSNMDLVIDVLNLFGIDPNNDGDRYVDFVKDRLGHDLKYSIDDSKVREELQWSPKITFKTGLKQTIDWYGYNKSWWVLLKEKNN